MCLLVGIWKRKKAICCLRSAIFIVHFSATQIVAYELLCLIPGNVFTKIESKSLETFMFGIAHGIQTQDQWTRFTEQGIN